MMCDVEEHKMANVSVRIVDADFYLDSPLPNFDVCYSELNQSKVSKVPVIRIFGATPRGQKTCLHIHGVMPYFYVPVPNVDDKVKYSNNFTQSLEFAINTSLGKSASQQQQYVYMVESVTKLPFYGYYAHGIEFLKIQLYNPRLIRKASELLMNGAVMNQFFQTYETHIPYLLQFFIDYNLHGMNLIHLAKVKFRTPLPRGNVNDSIARSPCQSPLGSPKYSQTNYDVFNDVTVLTDLILHNLPKQSTCALEVDASETDILNKQSIKGNLGTNPGLNAIWEDEKMRRRENHECSIIEFPESQERSRHEITSNERLKLQQLIQMLSERKSRNDTQLSEEDSLNLLHESLESCANTSSQSLNSGDENLIGILVDMAEGEDNTPLVETTFINNGLDDDQENNTEDDEDTETLLMSQTINNFNEDEIYAPGFLSHNQNNEIEDNSWSETFIEHIPQLDGQFDNSTCSNKSINGEKIINECNNINIKSIKDNVKQNGSKHSCLHKSYIPQLDGNSDWISSDSSSEDFKLSSKKRVNKTYRKRKVRSIPNKDSDGKSVSSESIFTDKAESNTENFCGSYSQSPGCSKNVITKSLPNKEPLIFLQPIKNCGKEIQKLKSPRRKKRKLSLEMNSDQLVHQTQPLSGETQRKKYPKRTKSLPNEFLSKVTNFKSSNEKTFQGRQNRSLIKKRYNIKNVQVVVTDIMKTDFATSSSPQIIDKKLISTSKSKKRDFSTPFEREPYEPLYYDSLSALCFGSPKHDTFIPVTRVLSNSPSEENETCTVVLESPNVSPHFPFQNNAEEFFSPIILPHCDVLLDHSSLTDSTSKKILSEEKNNLIQVNEWNLSRHTLVAETFSCESETIKSKKNILNPSSSSSSTLTETNKMNVNFSEENVHHFESSDLIQVHCNKSIDTGVSQSKVDKPLEDIDADTETLCHMEFNVILENSQKVSRPGGHSSIGTDDGLEVKISVEAKFDNPELIRECEKQSVNQENIAVTKVDAIESNLKELSSPNEPQSHFQGGLEPSNTSLPLTLDIDSHGVSDTSMDLISPPLFEKESTRQVAFTYAAEDNVILTENFHECRDNITDDSHRSLSLLSTGSEDGSKNDYLIDENGIYVDFEIGEKSVERIKLTKEKEVCMKSFSSSDEILECVSEKEQPIKTLSDKNEKFDVLLTPLIPPPTRKQVMESLKQYGLQEVKYQGAFFSKTEDASKTVSSGSELRDSWNNHKGTTEKVKQKSCGAMKFFQEKQIRELHGLPENSDVISADLLPELQNMILGNNDVVITPCKLPPCPEKIWKSLQLINDKEMENQTEIKNNQTESYTRDNEKMTRKNLEDHSLFSPIQYLSQQTKTMSTTTSTQHSTPGHLDDSKMLNSDKINLDNIADRSKLRNKSKEKVELKFRLPEERFNASDIEGITPNNTFGFDVTQQNLNDAKALHVNQHLTLVSIELHITTRRHMKPDPTMDPITCIFYFVHADPSQQDMDLQQIGVFLHESNDNKLHTSDDQERNLFLKTGFSSCKVNRFDSEAEMLLQFASFIQDLDPDILLGYEVQMLSWGYLIERAASLDINMCHSLSRITESQQTPFISDSRKSSNISSVYDESLPMSITGRIILNVWRVMRSEVTLRRYTFENVAYHVLHQRFPAFSFQNLSEWWKCDTTRWRVCQHYFTRCKGNFLLLDHIDFVNRTSELARVFGILFYSVISRGTQFRVESMMLRIAKPLNYIPVSPNFQQISKMAAPECIQLVLEPESNFYVDPVIVLDFQSLYPSIIIAYNYCYSTCLGRVQSFSLNEEYRFGATSLKLPFSQLKKLSSQENIHISPNNVGFVTSNVRKGVLPRMLEEILSTRIMVKGAMKKAKHDKTLHRMLDSRQLGLKLIANVTYGYTSANFSGRMPCIEIGDSVVRKGRETLERAIELVNTTQKWNARVVYGDTDSLFVLLKGASKERAFAVAKEIVDEVTALNPKPIKLKFEKVYQPCVLMTKKRYVGYMYESFDQKEPVFDAKGIETVRRDNCPAVSKIVEKSLRILFETKDISLVKSYVQKQFLKIMEGKVTMQDFIFGKEYRGLQNYKPGACVPALTLARRGLKLDRRSEPRIGERVPYVIIHGSPGLPLIQLVKSPLEVINNNSIRLNDIYYITKQICPALDRIFSLLTINVHMWYTDLPRVTRIHDNELSKNSKKGTIAQYFRSSHCPICEELTMQRICSNCQNNPQKTIFLLTSRNRKVERRFVNLMKLCNHCSSAVTQTDCISLDCPVFFKLSNVKGDFSRTDTFRDLLKELGW